MKKTMVVCLGVVILVWGLYKLAVGVIVTGAVMLYLALLLKTDKVMEICAAIIKKKWDVDIMKNVVKETSDKVKQIFPNITNDEIENIESAETLKGLSAAVSGTVVEQCKESCYHCGSSDIQEIEWNSKFDKVLTNKDAFDKKVYKCNTCGTIFLKYASN